MGENIRKVVKMPSASSTHGNIIPSLPNHIGLKILWRMPRYMRSISACVCRSWRDALNSRAIAPNAVDEEWVYICVLLDSTRSIEECMWTDDCRWVLLDPISMRTKTLLPPLLLRRLSIGEYGVQTISLNTNLFVLGLGFFDEAYDSLCYSDQTGEWSVLPHMSTNRCFFACAALGKCVYVAGGNDFIKKNLKSVERFDILKNQWETLPDMVKSRDLCSGFILNAKFYVIGGYKKYYGEDYHQPPDYKVHFSGEYFDPETEKWTLVPNMWPEEFGPAVNGVILEPIVAVVKNTLYAMKFNTDDIFEYDALQNRWVCLGSVGKRIDNKIDGCRLVGVGEELWVILHARDTKDLTILACNPRLCHAGETLSFRQIELNLGKRFIFLQFCGMFHVA